MKQLLPILFTGFLACAAPAFSQTWLAPDGIWTYHLTGGFIGVNDYFNLQTGPDTVINGQVCKKMAVTGAPFSYPASRFAYADGDRVYAYQSTNNIFVKLYDFTLAPGAIVSMPTYPSIGFFQYRIEAVDTVQAGSFWLRRQQVAHLNAGGNPSGWNFDILEGLGMVGQPFSTGMEACSYFFLDEVPLCSSVVDGFDIKFSCYRSDGGSFSPFGLNCAAVHAQTPEPPPALHLQPNPVTDALTILVPDISQVVLQTQLFNAGGQCLQTHAGLSGCIDTANLPSGMYFILIDLEDGRRLIRRFVRK